MPLGGLHWGAAAGWARSESSPDTVQVAVIAARTVKGDPIGFMEGVFGPSISLGAGLGVTSTEDPPGGSRTMLSANAGFQFSVFPTVAVGADISGIRIMGDSLEERVFGFGFTSIFDKRFRGHYSLRNGTSSVGFDLDVSEWLTVRSGSDGSSWNSGLSFQGGWFSIDWAVVLNKVDCRQVLGIALYPGGGS